MRQFAAAALCLAFGASAAMAQTYPNKPVRVIIPFGVGGVTDVVARVVADDMSKRLGQPFIAENRTGAGGLIAARAVKSAAPDGYTLYSGSCTPFTSTFLKDNPMDCAKELQPISLLTLGDQFIYVRSELGINTLKEFVAKAKTTRLKHSSPAITQHALMSLIGKQLGFDYDNIPYKTSDQVVAALLSGEGDFVLTSLPGFQPHIQSGKLKVIGTIGAVRSPLLPNVPTVNEQGGNIDFRFSLAQWTTLGVPMDIVNKLSATVADTIKTPAVVEKINAFAVVPTSSAPEGAARAFEAEMKAYREAAAIIKLEPQ